MMSCFSRTQRSIAGFSLVEGLVAIAIAGILASAAAPGFLAWRSNTAIRMAQDTIYQGLHQGRSAAMSGGKLWQVSFRNLDGSAQWAIHSVDALPDWSNLDETIEIDPANTTLNQADGSYHVKFNPRGQVHGQMGRITLVNRQRFGRRRCVFVSTLLGAMRKSTQCSTPSS